ncbi:MAG: tetratricopeptide repeat protein [Phycisphaerales bacterium]
MEYHLDTMHRHPAPCRNTLALASAAMLALAGGTLHGCSAASKSTGPYTAASDAPRDPQRAQELHAEAMALLRRERPLDADDTARVERLLRQTLDADLYHGPAHNNLGIILLERGELYDAAREFEWARRLMPGHPDPRVNLAITLERAGKTDEALSAYASALDASPEYLPAIQGKASLLVRSDRLTPDTAHLLETIALRGDERWREWALLWSSKARQRG